jgi:ankyrin repeat protein
LAKIKELWPEKKDELITIGYEPPCSPLMLAAWLGDADLVEVLFRDFSCDLEFKDSDDRTPLLRACACGHYDVVACLIRLGAKTNVATAYGHTQAQTAAKADC